MYRNKISNTIKVSLVDKIIILTTFICFMATLVFSLLSFYKAKQNQIRIVERSLQQYADECKNSIDQYFQYNFQVLEYLASYKEIYSMDKEKQYKFLKDKEKKLDFEHFIIMNLDGEGYYINTNEIRDQSDEQFFEDVIYNERFLTEPFMEVYKNRSITTLSVSIYDLRKKVGALCGVIDLDKIYKIFEDKIVGKDGYSFLINDNGDYVAHKNMDYVNDSINIFEDLNGKKNDIKFFKVGIEDDEALLGEVILDGVEYYASFNSLNFVNWNVVFLIPKSEALAGLNTFIIFQMLAILFGILLVIFGMRVVYKTVENHKLAYTDSLTNINNRAALDSTLNKLNNNYKEKITIVSFDLNDFKYCNDTYGHHIGDELLCVFSNILKKVLGNIEFIGRMGGDEFMAIMVDIEILYIERKLNKIQELILEYNKKSKYKLNISYGYSVRNIGDTTPLIDIYKEADKNMYRFKKKYKEA